MNSNGKMKVYVNVYDILKNNKYIECLGIGIYHTGNPSVSNSL